MRYDLKLPQYIANFIDDGYDEMDTIIHTLTEQDLIEIGINKRGHRKRIMLNIERLKKEENVGHVSAVDPAYGDDPVAEGINANDDSGINVEGINICDTMQVDNLGVIAVNIQDTQK